MIVQFTTRYGVYNNGERAGFTSEEARRLIAVGIATPVIKPQPARTVIKPGPEPGRKPRKPQQPRKPRSPKRAK